MRLELKSCIVRDWLPGDEIPLAKYANNPAIARNLRDLFPHPYTFEDAKRWIEGTADEDEQVRTAWAIDVDGEAVGGISLKRGVDIFRRSAEIGFWLGEPFWGRGIMSEAVEAITEHGFRIFDICRIHAGVFEWNPGSKRVLEKAGYDCEGLRRRSVTKEGRTIDMWVYAIVRENDLGEDSSGS